MKHKKLKVAKDLEWVQPVPKGYLMGCCDCGLVHRLDFRIVKGTNPEGKYVERVQFRATRAPKYTSAMRKKYRIKVST